MRTFIRLLKEISLSIILLSFTGFAYAQKGTIKGLVKDENGPLSNASVTVEGKGRGTTTNDKGEYELKADPGNYTVIISYVGMRIRRIAVSVSAGQTITAGIATRKERHS